MSLLRAEMLKIARRRGLMTWSLLLTLGAVVLTEVILVSLHAANPARHGPAGGRANLENLTFLIGGLGNIAAILVAATAGTQDVANGVFRDLVVTGRSRATLFAVRIPGALAVFLPMLAAAFGLGLACTFLFAGDRPTPPWRDVGNEALYLLLLVAVDIVITVGFSAFVSSRVVVGVLIAWNAIVGPLLMSIHSLGGARKLVDIGAAQHFGPRHMFHETPAMSSTTAVLVLLGWAAVFFWAGRFWTVRRDA